MQTIGIYIRDSWKTRAALFLAGVIMWSVASPANGQSLGGPYAGKPAADSSSAAASSTAPIQMQEVTVVGQLDQARQQIVPDLAATVYTIDQQGI